jgi:hypothetical protein
MLNEAKFMLCRQGRDDCGPILGTRCARACTDIIDQNGPEIGGATSLVGNERPTCALACAMFVI